MVSVGIALGKADSRYRWRIDSGEEKRAAQKRLLLGWGAIAMLRLGCAQQGWRRARVWNGQMWGRGKGPIKDELLVLDEQLRRQMAVTGARNGSGWGEWTHHGFGFVEDYV